MSWNEARIDELKTLWAEGYSASQIAGHLGGVTRHAVIGKAHRLGLSSRKAGFPRRERHIRSKCQTQPVHSWKITRSSSKPFAPAKRATIPPTPQPLPETAPLRLALLDLTENTCRWPIGNPQDENFCFCGCRKSGNGPYCEYHARIAYQKYVRRPKR